MSIFELKRHSVKEAAFLENLARKKKADLDIKVEGNLIIPKEQGRDVVAKLKMSLGGKDDRMYLMLETITVFSVQKQAETVTEPMVRQECLPVAMAKLRETVRQVSGAYGITPLELPPFREEQQA